MSHQREPYPCSECESGKVRLTRASYEIRVGDEKYVIQAVEQLRCDFCGAVSFTPSQLRELDYRSACFVRAAHNLVGPDDIRELREKLGLTQAELEGILRVGPKTVARWEAGVVHQNRGIDAVLRVHLALARNAPRWLERFGHEELVGFLTQLPELLPSLMAEPPIPDTGSRGLTVEVQCNPIHPGTDARYEVQTSGTTNGKVPNVRLAFAA